MLGSVLARFSQMSDNNIACLEVLRRILNLGKQILRLNEQIPDQKQKLNEGVQCIVVGTTTCISQLARANIFRFLAATVNADSLKDFQVKIEFLYSDIQFLTLIGIGERVPKFGSLLQKFYAYQSTVGIKSRLESVIQLLDLNAQDAIPIVVVAYGFGGISKMTLADAVYAHIDLQSSKHCRIHIDQDCTTNDLKGLQEWILKGLFGENLQLKNCDEGRGRLWSFTKKYPSQPLFLYIDNGLKLTDIEQLLPEGLGSCLPPKNRILVTTRNLQETNTLVGKGILELAGSQLAINTENTKNMVVKVLKEGKVVKKRDISNRMVDFVYNRLLESFQEAFLDITSYFYVWLSEFITSIVGEEEFRALEVASFVKKSEDGWLIVHDIVLARGKKLSEQNRSTDPETLLECLEDEEKLKNLKGIFLDEYKYYEQPPAKINHHHFNCMSNSLRVLLYGGLQIIFREKCHKPFEQLRVQW